MKFLKQGGSAIFEILIVIAVMGIVITSVVASSTRAIKNSLHARYQAESTRRAQELVEWLRSERDNSWQSFGAKASIGDGTNYYCSDALIWGPSGCSSSGGRLSGTPFVRTANLRLVTNVTANDTVELTVVVSWTDGTGDHTSRVSTKFTSWNN